MNAPGGTDGKNARTPGEEWIEGMGIPVVAVGSVRAKRPQWGVGLRPRGARSGTAKDVMAECRRGVWAVYRSGSASGTEMESTVPRGWRFETEKVPRDLLTTQ